MDALIEAKVSDFLRNWLHYNPYDCGTIVECMRVQARIVGTDIEEDFRFAGLGAGPEGRIAAGIVDRALMGGGCETSDYAIRMQINEWVRRNPRKGM